MKDTQIFIFTGSLAAEGNICAKLGEILTEVHPDRHVNIQPRVQALPEFGNP